MTPLELEQPLSTIRPYDPPTDRNFILSSWIKSYRRAPSARILDPMLYSREQHALVCRLLDRSTVMVAVDPLGATTIHGWVVATPRAHERELSTVHYTYVKDRWRRLGVGKMLLDSVVPERRTSPLFFTHQAPGGMDELLARLAPFGIFNPYRIHG